MSDHKIKVMPFFGTTPLSSPESPKHVGGHFLQTKAGLPSPIVSCSGVIDRIWPRIGNLLAVVRLIAYLKFRHVSSYGSGNLAGCYAHRGNIIRGANRNPLGLSLHKPDCRANGVVHIHHRQTRVLPQKAAIAPMGGGFKKDIDGIVGSTSTGARLIPDQSRISEAPDVEAMPCMIPCAPAFTGDLADAINRCGVGDGVLRRIVPGRHRPGHPDGAGPVYPLNPELDGGLEYVQQAVHIETPRRLRVLLALRR